MDKNQPLPGDLAPRLLDRFSSHDGYTMEPNLISALQTLKRPGPQRNFNNIVTGVVTNSDDRVPSVLSSSGVHVSPLRYGTQISADAILGQSYDIDFHCMSYDVGVEKPDKFIFEAAERMLKLLLSTREMDGPDTTDLKAWKKVHVGDEYAKDVTGAMNAGWNPVLLDSDNQCTDIPYLESYPSQTLPDLFNEYSVVRVYSLQNLIKSLVGGM